jgi:hypothetical protein
MSNNEELYPPFPELSDKLKTLLFQYYEAEFDGEVVKAALLKKQIDTIKFKMSLGETHEVPF